jgi:hypothetical protein
MLDARQVWGHVYHFQTCRRYGLMKAMRKGFLASICRCILNSANIVPVALLQLPVRLLSVLEHVVQLAYGGSSSLCKKC